MDDICEIRATSYLKNLAQVKKCLMFETVDKIGSILCKQFNLTEQQVKIFEATSTEQIICLDFPLNSLLLRLKGRLAL